VFGIRTALFAWTVVGVFALGALIGSIVGAGNVFGAIAGGIVLAGSVSMILALRRRLGLWPGSST
jgi:hypothetical protein